MNHLTEQEHLKKTLENNLINQFKGFLTTPPLWKEEFLGLKQIQLPSLDFFKDSVVSFGHTSLPLPFVLGKRMEKFLELILKKSPNYKIVAQNVQVLRDKITLGEIDFLLEQINPPEVIHLETVYKFYIYDPSFKNEMERWIGPNRKDSLLLKIKKLKEHQLPLLYKSETSSILSDLKLDIENLHQEVCFKANLFLPQGNPTADFSYLNKECIAGIWIKMNSFSDQNYGQFKYYSPKKLDWPCDPKENKIWYSYGEILPDIKKFHEQQRSPLVWIRRNENTFERLFVVWW